MPRRAVVAGATGLVGTCLLQQLAADPAWSDVRVIGRRRPDGPLPAKLAFVQSDMADFGALAATLAADDVFCCLGTTLRDAGSREAFERVDHDMVVALARAASAAGAKRFLVVSAVGASPRSPAFYSRVKGRMEAAVAAVPFEAVHIVQPSLLLGARRTLRPGERAAQLLSPLLSPVMQGPLAKYRPVQAEDVARALLRLALEGPAGVHRHALPLRGPA